MQIEKQNINKNLPTRSVFLTIGVLLIMAMPAYAGNIGDKNMEQAAPVRKVVSKDVVAVDLYGNGMLMLEAPAHLSPKTTTTVGELLDYLAPIPVEARSLTAEKIGDRIIIRPATPAHVNSHPQLARRPILTSPRSSASRLMRSKNIIVMNSIQQK